MTNWYLIEFYVEGEGYDYNDYMGENAYEAIGKCIVGNPCAIIQKVALILKFEDMFAEMGNKND